MNTADAPDAPTFPQSTASVHVASIRIAGTEFALPPSGVTAFVGGNNVGKSTILREIIGQLSIDSGLPGYANVRILEDLKLSFAGSASDAVDWMAAHASQSLDPTGMLRGFLHPQGPGVVVSADHVERHWAISDRLSILSPFMVHYSEPLSRAHAIEGVQMRQQISDPPTHPFHKLQDDPDLVSAISAISEAIFRKPLTLDRMSLTTVLRVGAVSVPAPPIDAVTTEYREALAALPNLSVQGEGMKSLLGLLLPVVTTSHQIVIIDEPEAFLHPPQAFQLGATLARMSADRLVQILVSTHDRNFLAGLLSIGAPVSVVRLDRTEDVTTASQLNPEDVNSLWTDPVLRYSNVLDGIFHRAVVVAEADPDCRFYAATLDAMDDESQLEIPPSEVHFVPASGKDGLAKVVKALAAVRVRVVACADLDVLDNEATIRRLVEAFGGDWSDFADIYAKAVNDLKPKSVARTCDEVQRDIATILGARAGDPWDESARAALKGALRLEESGFAGLKRYGMETFSGESRKNAETLLARLDKLGICCVREGELERLAPALGVRKSASWLPAALKADAHKAEAPRKLAARFLTSALHRE